MKWFSHRLFAVGMAAVCKFDPIGIALAYAGSTVPDSIDFFQVKMGASFNRIHRKHSHAWVWYAIILFILYGYAYPYLVPYLPSKYVNIETIQEYILAFFFGIFSHIFLDMLTVTGVPRFINPNKKFAVKLVTTNKFSETIFTFCFFIACSFWLYFTKNQYITFFIDKAYQLSKNIL